MDIKVLTNMLERRCGHSLKSAADYEWLAYDFQSKIGESIGINTLKRLLNFHAYDKGHRESTLDVVARYLGFSTWRQLEQSAVFGTSSFGITTEVVNPNDLHIGSAVEVTYRPDRTLRFEYTGNSIFLVTHSTNSQLQNGDKAEIHQFMLGYPLLATQIVRQGKPLGEYTAAKIGGLTSILVTEE